MQLLQLLLLAEAIPNAYSSPLIKAVSHIDVLADAQGTNMDVHHTAKYVGCKFISRSLIGTIRSCAKRVKKDFEHVQ